MNIYKKGANAQHLSTLVSGM